MATSISVQLISHGSEPHRVPVLCEVLDAQLDPYLSQWLGSNASWNVPVDPGIWGVRARLASGAVVQKAVQVDHGSDVPCVLPLYPLSPHETNSWAYFTQPISQAEKRTFNEAPYRGAWIRLWSRGPGPFWRMEPEQGNYLRNVVSRDSDGVVYRLTTVKHEQYAIQVGGPRIPWKFVGVPFASEVTLLVRPVSILDPRTHPLEVLVASENLDGTALLTLLRRGDVGQAQSLSTARLPAERLHGHWEPAETDYTTAAAVGYYLIRTNNFSGLDQFLGGSLDRVPPFWNPSLPDFDVLELWRWIDGVRRQWSADEAYMELIGWLLGWMSRGGWPVYAEGLRLLQKAILLFANPQTNTVHQQAILGVVNAYVGASDPFAVATTFTGSRPDNPSAQPIYGFPEDGPFEYVYREGH